MQPIDIQSNSGKDDTALQAEEKCPNTNGAVIEATGSPPDGGYGWVCVACVFLINAHTWGLNSSFSVFLGHYLTSNTFPGTSDLDYAFIGGLSISQALLISPLATITTRKYGTNVTLLIGVLLQSLSLVGASFTRSLWQLLLSQGVCFGWGIGFLFVGSVGIIPQWFLKNRSVANGIATGGSGIGGMLYSLATNAMIQNLGLPWAFRILAVVSFAVNLTCAILMKDRNKIVQPTQKALDLRLFRRYEFWLLTGWGFLSMLGYVVLLFSLPNFATSIGLSAKQGSIVAALLNLGQGIGRPLVGYFSDRAGRINIAGFMTFICSVLCFLIWIFARSFGVLLFFALISGTVAGTFWTAIGPVAAEVVGLKDLPSALSITWIALVPPTTVSEAIGLKLRRQSGNIYLPVQIFTASMYLAAALCMLFLRGWKIGERGSATASISSEAELCPPDDEVPATETSALWKLSFQWKRV